MNDNPLIFYDNFNTSDDNDIPDYLNLNHLKNNTNDNKNNTNNNDNIREERDINEIYDLIKDIKDPEHPLTLSQLDVARLDGIDIDEDLQIVTINFTPTIPHCSMATLIGLSLRVKLLRSLPNSYKIDVKIAKGTHQSEDAINKQLNDKERVAAALENSHLLNVVNKCIQGQD